jgi:oligopeptide/dipeptide ABC transporter ATP-binding protein
VVTRSRAPSKPILEVRGLRLSVSSRKGTIIPVDGVSFHLNAGETLGIVGESGSGKTMTALSILRVNPQPASRVLEGEILLDGEDLLKKSDEEMRAIRGLKISMIPQDPNVSLNPAFTIGNQLREALSRQGDDTESYLQQRSEEALSSVQIAEPRRRLKSYPHHLSGGIKQRIIAAIAMANYPRIVIADEPTTALDATIQLQFLHLLREIQIKTGMSIIFITHDFDVVARMCHRVAVMYAGRIVEVAPVRDIFERPSHPYSEGLIASLPNVGGNTDRLFQIDGQPPRLHDLPTGCRFAPRCRYSKPYCHAHYPAEMEISESRKASCWRLDQTWDNLPPSSK